MRVSAEHSKAIGARYVWNRFEVPCERRDDYPRRSLSFYKCIYCFSIGSYTVPIAANYTHIDGTIIYNTGSPNDMYPIQSPWWGEMCEQR